MFGQHVKFNYVTVHFCFLHFLQEQNLNLIVGDEYGPNTKLAMSRLSEREISFELIEV